MKGRRSTFVYIGGFICVYSIGLFFFAIRGRTFAEIKHSGFRMGCAYAGIASILFGIYYGALLPRQIRRIDSQKMANTQEVSDAAKRVKRSLRRSGIIRF